MNEETNNKEDKITLGNKIHLVGFRDAQPGSLIVAKKIIGNYVKKIEDTVAKLDEIKVAVKSIHGDTNDKSEITIKAIIDGKIFTSEITDFNMFVTLSKVFDNIIKEIEHDIKK